VPEDASVTTSGRVKLAEGLYQWCVEVGRGYESGGSPVRPLREYIVKVRLDSSYQASRPPE